MKKLTLLSSVVLTAATLGLSLSAMGATPTFTNGIHIYESQDGGVYTTDWRVYPMTVEGYTGANYKKPDSLLVALTADGKTSAFRGIISMSCSSPVSSHIVSSEDYKSLKEAMADYTIPRPVVNNLFAKFCKY